MNVLVIGPHRSGTSAVARLVNLCGLYIGEPDELLPPTPENEMGYWEARWLVQFDDDVLSLFGADWRSAARLHLDSLPAALLEGLQQRALAWCKRMDQQGHWVSKDPRLCLTARFWLRVRPDTLVVLCVRHPEEAVPSMMQRTPCPFTSKESALAAWRAHMLGAVIDTATQPRLVLDYSRIMTAPAAQITRLLTFLRAHLPGYVPPRDWEQRTSQALVPRLRHHTATHLAAPCCEARDLEVYEALLGGEQERLSRALQAFPDPPLAFDVNRFLHYRADHMAQKDRHIANLDRHIANLETHRAQVDSQLASLATQVSDKDRHIAHLETHRARVDSQLASLATQVSDKDRLIAHLEAHQQHLETLLHLTEAEVQSLKRSWSYRVGRVMVFPASLLKMGMHHLRRSTSAPPPSVPETYQLYPSAAALSQMSAAYARLTAKPRLSLLTPVYNTPPAILRETLDSVLHQVYQEWELCLADDGSTSLETLTVLEEYSAKETSRIKLVHLRSNRGIAAASNAAADLATGEFVALLDHDDLLTADALLEVAMRLETVPEADLIYSDEDKVTMDGVLMAPFHKPGFAPELLLSVNYICHFAVIRRTVFEHVGRFHEGFDGSQDYDLFLRVTEATPRVEHIPKVLYHWRMIPGSAAADVRAKGGPWHPASRKALGAAITRRGWQAEVVDGIVPSTYRVTFAITAMQPVTLIIPTKDRVDLLRTCVESVRQQTQYPHYEILIISNNSEQEETYAYLERAQQEGVLRFLCYDVPFNYAALNNFAVRHCRSPYLLFLNNDVEVDSAGWLTSMLEYAQQPAIGAVGAKLLYPDGTIQHAGIVLGVGGVAGHSHKHMPAAQHGYFSQANVIRNYSAVTAACLLTRREVFDHVGGFSEELAVAFNDVDLCLKIRQAGYRIVYTPYARLFHHESASRGRDETPAQAARFRAEIAYMTTHWGHVLYQDPYYNPNLTLWREDFSLKTPEDEVRLQAFTAQFPARG